MTGETSAGLGGGEQPNLVRESVPGLPERPLLLAGLGGPPHGCQQRDDGPPLLTEGHHEGVEHLEGHREAGR